MATGDRSLTILLLSGASGAGKTSACAMAASAAPDTGKRLAGILCPAVFKDGVKVGIDYRDLQAGPRSPSWPLARALVARGPNGLHAGGSGGKNGAACTGNPARQPAFDDSSETLLRFGMWEFYKTALAGADETARRELALACGTPGDWLVCIDEIGPLELNKGRGLMRTLAAVDTLASGAGAPDGSARGQAHRVTIIVVARPDIAAWLETRWPGSRIISLDGLDAPTAARALLAGG